MNRLREENGLGDCTTRTERGSENPEVSAHSQAAKPTGLGHTSPGVFSGILGSVDLFVGNHIAESRLNRHREERVRSPLMKCYGVGWGLALEDG